MSGILIHPAGDFNLAVLRMKYDFFSTKKFYNRLQMSKCWTGKRGAFMAIMLRILWTKNLHGSSVYMSFSFNWTDISRNKSQVNWGTSKIRAMSVMSSFRCISINCFNRPKFLPVVITRKCTFLDNSRAITQEGNMETRQMIPFFHLLFPL